MARRGRRSSSISENNKTRPSIVATGGSWSPLPISSIEFIAQAAFDILTAIGVSDAPKILISKIEKEGGICKKGRLLYPVGLLLDTIKNSPKRVLLAGQLKKMICGYQTPKSSPVLVARPQAFLIQTRRAINRRV